ncbi:MAG: DUF1150 family protein [Pikeienuella sp.]
MTTEDNIDDINTDEAETKVAIEAGQIVYVRPLRNDEIPDDAPVDALYGIHDAAGNRIGLAPDRDLAFMAARQHELQPVSVH